MALSGHDAPRPEDAADQDGTAAAPPVALTVEYVKQQLQRLRQGQGLSHLNAVLDLSPQLRARLAGGNAAGTAEEAIQVSTGLRHAIDQLGDDQRRLAAVDFNLSEEHAYPTLTERQESLAQELGCAGKTVRRRADRTLDSLAIIIAAPTGPDRPPNGTRSPVLLASHAGRSRVVNSIRWQERLRSFWRLSPNCRVDIVCSEHPEHQRPAVASPDNEGYLRYAKFADLDTLVYVRSRLAQVCPDALIRDFSATEYDAHDAEKLIVIGGPSCNAAYREFLPQLPFRFDPSDRPGGNSIVFPRLGAVVGPRWNDDGELLDDVAVFTRLTVNRETTVFLLGGCLTLGVLGAAKLFLQIGRGAHHTEHLDKVVGDADFVLVNEARRMGGITEVGDLVSAGPLLLLARDTSREFAVVADNTSRLAGRSLTS